MAIPFLNHLDLQDISQLQNAILHKTTSGLASTATGKIIFDTGSATIKYYDGSAWIEVGGDTDNYVDSLAFNTSDGILTVGRTGSLSDLTVDLDGRYQIAGSYDNYLQWQITDGAQTDDVTTNAVVKFAANSTPGTAGAVLTGTGTTVDPYLVTYTFPNDDTTYSADVGLTLAGTQFSVNVADSQTTQAPQPITTTASRLYQVETDDTNHLVVNVPWSDNNDDNYVDGATLSGTTLTLTRTGALANLTVDLSSLDDTDTLQSIAADSSDNDRFITTVANDTGAQTGYSHSNLKYNPSTETLKVTNLIISGTQTTVNTETINLADNIITLNSNETGTPSQNAGIEVERGTSANVQLNWNESTDDWEFTAYDHAASPQTPVLTTYKIPRTYSTTVGNNSLTEIAVVHNLGTRNVIVQLFDTTSYETVYADVVRTDLNTVTLTFASAPAAGDITVLISTAGA